MTTRIIVCGSRDWSDQKTLEFELLRFINPPTAAAGPVVIVHGACPFGGADQMADEWAARFAKYGVTVERHPAKERSTAGFHARNQAMADAGAWLCIGFTDGRDPQRGTWGTGDMFSRALAAGIPVRGVPSRRSK